MRIEEDDSVLLSALAIVPHFGPSLLDRLVYNHVTVDAIYYEFKRVRDLPYKLPVRQSTTTSHVIKTADEQATNNANATPFPDPEEAFAEYCDAIARHGVRPTQPMNEAIISGFLRKEREERAKEVLQWMRGEGLDIGGLHACFADYCIFIIY